MDVMDMTTSMLNFLRRCGEVAAVKNRDYHPDRVAMLEILQTSWETGVRPEQDLWGRMRKQLSALRGFVIDGRLESEPPDQRMMDIINYTAIIHFWSTHKIRVVADALNFVTLYRPCEITGGYCGTCRDGDASLTTEPCDRCAFLTWLIDLHRDLKSPAPRSLPTPKPPA